MKSRRGGVPLTGPSAPLPLQKTLEPADTTVSTVPRAGHSLSFRLVILAAVALAGCGSDDEPKDTDGGPADGGPVQDGGQDAGVPDGGSPRDLGEDPVYSGSFEEPRREWLQGLGLPPGPGGTGYALFDLPIGTMIIDPDDRGPVSAAAECAAMVLACWEPDLRNYAGCLGHIRHCPDDRPWESDGPLCCSSECEPRYQELRRQGLEPAHALTAAIWDDPSCMPGLEPDE